MAEIIRTPKMSDCVGTINEGTIIQFYKKIGDQVKKGELLADVENEKAVMECESPVDGTLLYAGEGNVMANGVVAIIGDEHEDYRPLLAIAHIKAELVRLPGIIADGAITDAHIAEWYKSIGDTVKKDDPLVKMTTGLYILEYESHYAGTLLYQNATVGFPLRPNDIVAIIGEPDADWQALLKCYRS